MAGYIGYYHEDRTHLGLAKDTPAGAPSRVVLHSAAGLIPCLAQADCTMVTTSRHSSK
jgi:hypothetical protein